MKKIMLIGCFLWGIAAQAQTKISMEAAVEQITTNHPTILQQDLYVQQQLILKDAGKQQPMFGVGYTIEEVGVAGFGVQSIYFQQNFNMPQIAKRKALLQEELSKMGGLQKQATQKQLARYVSTLYQQILFSKNQSQLNQQLMVVYEKIETIAQKRANVGETGQLPVLAAQTAQQQLQLQQMSNHQNFLVQLEQLKQFLMDSSLVDIADSNLVALPTSLPAVDLEMHPLVQQIDQSMVVNAAQSQVIQSQLLPQIALGFQTQMVNRTFPNFGAQIGVNVPLFRKGVKAQVEANDLNRKILEQNKIWQIQQLEGQQKIAQQQVLQLQAQLEQLETLLLPNLQQQQALSEKAYQTGELDYLNVLQTSQQIIGAQNQRLQLLYQLNLAWINYQYLMME